MNKLCREIISSTEELKRYNIYLVLLLIIFIFLFIFDYLYIHVDKAYFNLFIIFILFETIITKYYLFAKLCSLTIILSLINILIHLGIFHQNDILINNNKMKVIFYFSYSIIVHLLSFYVLFKAYKEMKAIFIEEYENNDNENENDIELTEYKNENNEI